MADSYTNDCQFLTLPKLFTIAVANAVWKSRLQAKTNDELSVLKK